MANVAFDVMLDASVKPPLANGDLEEVSSRAYDTMLRAGHAALLRSGAQVNRKTHWWGLIAAAWKHQFKPGCFPSSLDRRSIRWSGLAYLLTIPVKRSRIRLLGQSSRRQRSKGREVAAMSAALSHASFIWKLNLSVSAFLREMWLPVTQQVDKGTGKEARSSLCRGFLEASRDGEPFLVSSGAT
jgi:hypothetical protein